MDSAPLTNTDSYEHIYLESDEPESMEPTHIDAAISHGARRVTQTMTIFNDNYLGIRTFKKSQSESFHWIAAIFVNPRPTRRLGIAGKLRLAVLNVFGAIASLPFFLMTTDSDARLVGSLLALWILIFIGLSLTVVQRRREFVFETLHGRSELFRLASDCADEEDIHYFIKKLEQTIKNNRKKYSKNRKELLCEEMKQHRRLFDEGALTQPQFGTARRLILSAHDD